MTAHQPSSALPLTSAWPTIYALSRQTFRSSLHFAIASVNPDGTPHITPIGSLLLCPDAPMGLYYEVLTRRLPRNLETTTRVCVLAVRSDRWFWLTGLLRGRFATPPAVRLRGTAGQRREATPVELARFARWTARLRRLKGARMVWSNVRHVREFAFDAYEPVRLGSLTDGLWDSRPCR